MAPGPPDRSPNRFSALTDFLDNPTRKKKKPNPNQDIFPQLPKKCPTTHNPKFILISSADNTKPLSQLSPFAIKKSIEAISTEINSISQLRDGNLLVLTRNARIADKFLKAKSFPNLCAINVKLHETLNSVKGVIYSPCLKHVTEDEIIEEMKDQHVTGVYKFTRQTEGKTFYTGQIVLTFDLFQFPDAVEVAWYKVKVQPYIPSPMRCRNCQKLGHTQKRCNSNPTCNNCNLPPHNPDKCIRTQCANCAEEHPSSDRNCTKYVQAREILKIKTLEKCSTGEARRKYKNSLPLSQRLSSYASVTKNVSSTENIASGTINNKKHTENKILTDPATSSIQINPAEKQNSTNPTVLLTSSSGSNAAPTIPAENCSSPQQSSTSYTNTSPFQSPISIFNTNQNSSECTQTQIIQAPITNLTQKLLEKKTTTSSQRINLTATQTLNK